jgi:tyrosyl-tRNA synthetase
LVETNLAASQSEAKRLIEQGGVKIEGEKTSNIAAEIEISREKSVLIQIGKRKFLRITAN